jgi:hypothetical protein
VDASAFVERDFNSVVSGFSTLMIASTNFEGELCSRELFMAAGLPSYRTSSRSPEVCGVNW